MASPERSKLRLTDLKARAPAGTRLMNVKVPVDILNAIEQLAKRLKASKTDVVVALLNEALATAQEKLSKR
jgi:hypothetical protein